MKAVAAISTSLTLLACSSFRELPNIAQLQCEAAEAMVEQVLANDARRHVFELEPAATLDAQPPGDDQWDVWQGGQRTQAPPVELQRTALRHAPQGAVSRCPTIRQLLQQQQVRYGRIPQSIPIQDDLYPADIEYVSLPAISEDGQSAVLAYSSISGPLAASGLLVHLVRQSDGQWRIVGQADLWVS